MSLDLRSILALEEPKLYKVHLASWNGQHRPLDVFVRDKAEWDGWNAWRGSKDEFNRPNVLALIDFHPDPGTWLFGGIYKVLARTGQSRARSYTVEADPRPAHLVGRLKIGFARPGRIRAVKLEKYIDQMAVLEILREPYSGERFPGYENINHDFTDLEAVFRTSRPDWKAALESVKGVYLIADKLTGKKYVGAAYGDAGVWSRWSCYIGTGHGWNDELTELIAREGIEYARSHFRICLLEHRPAKTDDQIILDRERFWKEALLCRGAFGYNKN
jgi:hypothetical protein